MATAPCIKINQTTAVLRWMWEGAEHILATADPDYAPIRFTLHLDPSEHSSESCAHIEIEIPVRFKDKPAETGVCLRINPSLLNSFSYSTESNPSGEVESKFDSTICLDLNFRELSVLVPNDLNDPVAPARKRSGLVFDSIRELHSVTSLRIYIQESLLSPAQLEFISEAVRIRNITASSNPDHRISRMFNGVGGKLATLPSELPSYEAATQGAASSNRERPLHDDTLDKIELISELVTNPKTTSSSEPSNIAGKFATIAPPAPPSYAKANHGAASKRKRPRHDGQSGITISQLWEKMIKLESELGGLQADNTQLRLENAQLRERVTHLEGLEASLANGNDTEEFRLLGIEERVADVEDRVAHLEECEEEDSIEQIKARVMDEIVDCLRNR
jgi:regulator of replication initiation timing